MRNKKKLVEFLLKARTKTYAGERGGVKSALEGSKQMEYKEGDWLYRDVFLSVMEFSPGWKRFISTKSPYSQCRILETSKE